VTRPRDADQAPRRLFANVQAGKGLVGLLLGAGFVVLVGRPDIFELTAMAGLVMPLFLALASFTSLRLTMLEQAGLALSAMLIGYLCYLTGGLGSPLMVWLVLVPAEAALAGGRQAVARAGFAAALVLVALAMVQMMDFLPASRLPMPAASRATPMPQASGTCATRRARQIPKARNSRKGIAPSSPVSPKTWIIVLCVTKAPRVYRPSGAYSGQAITEQPKPTPVKGWSMNMPHPACDVAIRC